MELYLYPPPTEPSGTFTSTFTVSSRLRLKCDGTRAETRFRLSAKRTSPFKSAGASVQSTTGSRGVRISGSNAGYTMFRGNVKGTGYPLHSPFSPPLPLPCVTVCHHFTTSNNTMDARTCEAPATLTPFNVGPEMMCGTVSKKYAHPLLRPYFGVQSRSIATSARSISLYFS